MRLKPIPEFIIAVCSTILLSQIEFGWYGLGWNWVLLMVLVLAAFNLGYWGMK